ncbi:DUF2177 family protein [Stappia sp. BW2]|uniref:DUF2177 family protein n=1 Tax=Stappia sp. BW2 TaxID=2592622 RepID=UPI0011DEF6AB|nr:DUF2177 family protein [Stappia sp. BW2]TYC64587.1 DUF2177 family protein [Stappia sp. BW2]
MKYLTAYIATVLVFLAVDFVWLTQVSTRFYVDRIGHLMMERPNIVAAGVFYLFYVVGIVIFAVAPALKAESLAMAAILGGLFGLFTYGTYDVTNYATLRDWPISVVIVDVAWGTVLSAVSATAGYTITRLMS